ncbi:MAG: hypothetical protein JXR68_08880 [Bacteroidales bacterium]|nr:hypothetical protein [Bacteroidales bacterium]
MKKVILPFLLVLTLGFIGYEHYDEVLIFAKDIVKNPENRILNANTDEDEIIEKFYNDIYGEIILTAGEENGMGFRHILARHTTEYFINFDNKETSNSFSDETTTRDIIKAIRIFYNNCVDVPKYLNRTSNNKTAYLGLTTINREKIKCLLIVSDNGKIITFYPYTESAKNYNDTYYYNLID